MGQTLCIETKTSSRSVSPRPRSERTSLQASDPTQGGDHSPLQVETQVPFQQNNQAGGSILPSPQVQGLHPFLALPLRKRLRGLNQQAEQTQVELFASQQLPQTDIGRAQKIGEVCDCRFVEEAGLHVVAYAHQAYCCDSGQMEGSLHAEKIRSHAGRVPRGQAQPIRRETIIPEATVPTW